MYGKSQSTVLKRACLNKINYNKFGKEDENEK
jgi:hypothetical protein